MSDAECPAPWRYQETHGLPTRLLDAGGKGVLEIADDSEGGYCYFVASPHARELIRLAPEMAALLRKWQVEADPRLSTAGNETATLIDKLDSARKGTSPLRLPRGAPFTIDGDSHVASDDCDGCASFGTEPHECGGNIHSQSVYGPSILKVCDGCKYTH
jgi:hypothetical protein